MRGVVSHNMITIILCYVAVRDGVTALAVAVAVELAVEVRVEVRVPRGECDEEGLPVAVGEAVDDRVAVPVGGCSAASARAARPACSHARVE